jgi:hypothetical protein
MRVVVGVVLGGLLAGTSASAHFEPATYAGSWSGTWKNVTFKVSGPITATVTASADGSTLTVDYTISSLFNCGQASFSRVLARGVDFTDDGLNFTAANAGDWGTATVTGTSSEKLTKIKGSGVPTCRPDISGYTFKAKLKGTSLKGKMTITFSSGSKKKARSVFKVNRQ